MRSFRDRHPPAPGSLLLPGRVRIITIGRAGRPPAHAVNDNRRRPRRHGRWPAWRGVAAREAFPLPIAGGISSRMMTRWGWPGITLGLIGMLLALGYWL
jgi:hypothetical protein